ncbi:MAG TPA: hypothetical protein VG328_16875 [Stellaceae bacterium]|jgi:hypothetical protein|nr:hypothetical protein [Stellaceae bacterium]
MPTNPPVLVTRAHIGKGPGIVLISFAAPAGELGKGSVENVEVMRVAMTHATFKEFASLFNYTLGELGMGQPGPVPPAPTPANEPARRFERRSRPTPVPEKT